MKNSSIQLSEETKKKIASFGHKGESYEDIIKRLYDVAVSVQLKELLMSSEDTLTIEEFRKEVEKEWPRSK